MRFTAILLLPLAAGAEQVCVRQDLFAPGVELRLRDAQGVERGRRAGSCIELPAHAEGLVVEVWIGSRIEARFEPAQRITVTAALGRTQTEDDAAEVVRSEPVQLCCPNRVTSLLPPTVLGQESAPGQFSPFLRGLTGYQTGLLIDGVRLNNTLFRSGPNQYLALAVPASLEEAEILLGPGSAVHGGDAMGGVVQLRSAALPVPESGRFLSAAVSQAFDSVDQSWAGTAHLTAANRWMAGSLSASHARHGDFRPGGGVDSRSVLVRLLGLNPARARDLLGSRPPGTAYSQPAFTGKWMWRPGATQNLAAFWHHSNQRGVDSYRDQWGGLGRLQAVFEPQRAHLTYLSYQKSGAGFLDSVQARFSFNSLRDDSRRQGLRITDTITMDRNRADAYGYRVQGNKALASRSAVAAGFEYFDERVQSARAERSPVTGAVTARRGALPDQSAHRTAAVFGENAGD
ncbi:MAG: hypothetical protein FJW39_32515, partial [Acidobacteria bacterium]|nr:hypothetical protein [Acidobacteriota bacterium]